MKLFQYMALLGLSASSAFGQVGGGGTGGDVSNAITVLDLSDGTKRAVFKEARRTVLGADYEAPPEDDLLTIDPYGLWRRGVQDSFSGRALRFNLPYEKVGVRMFPVNPNFPAQFSELTRGSGYLRTVRFAWDLSASGYNPTRAKAWLGDEGVPLGLLDTVGATAPAGPRTVRPHRVFAQNVGELVRDVMENENYYFIDLQVAFNNPNKDHLDYHIRDGNLGETSLAAPLYTRGISVTYSFEAVNLLTGTDLDGNPVPGAHIRDGQVQYIEFDFRQGDTGPWTPYRIPLGHIPVLH